MEQEMNDQKISKQHNAHVASHIPGRLRIKLHPGSRTSEDLQQIKEKIGSRAGINGIRSNPDAGSLMVRYDRDRFDKEKIFEVLRDADVVLADLAGMKTPGGMDFNEAIESLGTRTGIDLKKTIPLAFVAAGLWSFARSGLMIESVPGWFFFWLALDSFVKLHRPHRS
jgi:Heavy metal associated domain 2